MLKMLLAFKVVLSKRLYFIQQRIKISVYKRESHQMWCLEFVKLVLLGKSNLGPVSTSLNREVSSDSLKVMH